MNRTGPLCKHFNDLIVCIKCYLNIDAMVSFSCFGATILTWVQSMTPITPGKCAMFMVSLLPLHSIHGVREGDEAIAYFQA